MRKSAVVAVLCAVAVLAAVFGILAWLGTDGLETGLDRQAQQAGTTPPENMGDAAAQAVPTLKGGRTFRLSPAEAQIFGYKFEVSSILQIDLAFVLPKAFGGATASPGGNMTSIESSGFGNLFLKFFPRPGGGWNVSGMMSDVQYTMNNQVPAFVSSLTNPFVLRVNSRGETSSFEFPKGTPDEAEKVVRALLDSLRIVYAREPVSGTWSTREENTTGTYEARYTIGEGESGDFSIAKEKTRYLTASLATESPQTAISKSTVRIDSSRAAFNVSKETFLPVDVDFQETFTFESKGETWAESTNSFRAGKTSARPPRELLLNLADFQANLRSDRYIEKTFYATESELDRMGAGLSVAQALDLFAQLERDKTPTSAGLPEAFLVNYLRQFPDAAFQLVSVLDADRDYRKMDEKTHLVLWRLLTAAGHLQAQQALAGALTHPDYARQTRVRAMLYASDFTYPEDELVGVLWDVYRNPQNATNNEMLAATLKNMSLLAIGALGSPEKLNGQLRTQVSAELSRNLSTVREPSQRELTLQAIGNAADPGLLPDVKPYFTDTSPEVRSAAYRAVRRMDDPEAFRLFSSAFEKERSPEVRASALETLQTMNATAESADWARTELTRDSDPEEQVLLVGFLGRSSGRYPQNKEALRALLRTNPSLQVKRKIYEFVVPEP